MLTLQDTHNTYDDPLKDRRKYMLWYISNYDTFGKYLRHMRSCRWLSLRQVESLTGISNAYISQLERSQYRIPSVLLLLKLAAALKVDQQEFLIMAGAYAARYASPEQQLARLKAKKKTQVRRRKR